MASDLYALNDPKIYIYIYVLSMKQKVLKYALQREKYTLKTHKYMTDIYIYIYIYIYILCVAVLRKRCTMYHCRSTCLFAYLPEVFQDKRIPCSEFNTL